MEPLLPLDLQHNGSLGLDFGSDELTLEDWSRWAKAHVLAGGGQLLATLITAPVAAMERRIQAICRAVEALPALRKIIVGIHLEGPFISPLPGYMGAHPAAHILPADTETMRRLLEAGQGLVKLVTLAPECDAGCATIRWLHTQGVACAAGHTDASQETLQAAIQAGLSLFTHLGNGCPGTLPRHDNIVQRALALADVLTLCFIPDGAHIPFFALRNYLRGLDPERVILVTDSISAAGCGPGIYPLGDQKAHVGSDGIARTPCGNFLAGSTLLLSQLLQHVGRELGSLDTQKALISNPRKVVSGL
jgi:N-acetylglucosamine-6-phosphate deacetylase